MATQISELKPASLWHFFAQINAIPRASKKESNISAFMEEFGKSLNLQTIKDEVGNVIIKKPATPGMEDRETTILQSHLDMVHQKNSDTQFDFDTQGIQMYVDGDWVKAKGTTLGADNGIGVATIMTLLASNDIPHPAIEALFTIDEETGMTGAKKLASGLLDGNLLLNLDTEEDDELIIGCAGGIDVSAFGTYTAEKASSGTALQIVVKGLTGGHSGVDIHLGRANANKILVRLLYNVWQQNAIQVSSLQGGSLRNAIPREASAIIIAEDEAAVNQIISDTAKSIQSEFAATDPNLTITVEATAEVNEVIPKAVAQSILYSLYACPNGIYRMTPGIETLVQTSNNLAKMHAGNGKWEVECLTRSSVDSEKLDLANAISAAFLLSGGQLKFGSEYPGWEPKPNAPIVAVMKDIYKKLHGSEPRVVSIHAGLECGIIGSHYPQLEMISFGPHITGAHSPDEKVSISSVEKFYQYFLEVMKHIPMKRS